MKRLALLVASHAVVAGAGFGLGIYTLPLLTAPAAPTSDSLGAVMRAAVYRGEFRRDLEGSDFLHWGEGTVYVAPEAIALSGRLAPGPDYRLYLSPRFVESEAAFLAVKDESTDIGLIATFRNFLVPIPPGTDPGDYAAVVVWCESFGQFITAAAYRPADPAEP